MNYLESIKNLVKTPQFSEDMNLSYQKLPAEIKELFQSGEQLKVRSIISGKAQHADTVEVVDFDE